MLPKSGQPKLLFVIDNLSTGGAQRQLINLATGLNRRNHQIDIFCYAPGDILAQPLYEAGIPVHWHFKRNRYSPDVIIALRRLIIKERYDIVLSFLTTPNFYAIVSGHLLNTHHIPVIVSERFYDLPKGGSKLERFVRQFYRLAAQVVVNSHHQRINLAQKYSWLQSRLSTIFNGYDLEVFKPAVSEPNNKTLK
jgi:glycosyltransferase involved in cell wall biosynthesis